MTQVETFVPTHFRIEKEEGVLGKYLIYYSYDNEKWHAYSDNDGYPRCFDSMVEAKDHLNTLLELNFGITIELKNK